MPEIKIRPASEEDIPALVAFEHSYKSNYCWQMEMANQEKEIAVNFREIRLPRQVTTEYPRDPEGLRQDWMKRTVLLVADIGGMPVAYISLMEGISPTSAWVTDLVVSLPYRRKGIGTALLLAAQDWAKMRRNRRMVLEVQSKNMPAIHLALKLGYEFCGYHDLYFANQDMALFFAHFLR
jgi:ribosomal protein S18 acetylase RimI-like enzyme